VSGSQGMAEFLLDTARVVLVPGDAFGSDRHLRISFACADAVIEEGLSSMIAALARLR
jgi:aspartate/methionine/tyrosine aminotransferase